MFGHFTTLCMEGLMMCCSNCNLASIRRKYKNKGKSIQKLSKMRISKQKKVPYQISSFLSFYDKNNLITKISANIPAGNYMLKVNNRNTRTRCEICSKLTIKTPEWGQWRHSGVFIANFEHISHLSLVFLLLTFNM